MFSRWLSATSLPDAKFWASCGESIFRLDVCESLSLSMFSRGAECSKWRHKCSWTCSGIQTAWIHGSPHLAVFEKALRCKPVLPPSIWNGLGCEQLTRQQPGNWQPSGAVGDSCLPPPHNIHSAEQNSRGEWKCKVGCRISSLWFVHRSRITFNSWGSL